MKVSARPGNAFQKYIFLTAHSGREFQIVCWLEGMGVGRGGRENKGDKLWWGKNKIKQRKKEFNIQHVFVVKTGMSLLELNDLGTNWL